MSARPPVATGPVLGVGVDLVGVDGFITLVDAPGSVMSRNFSPIELDAATRSPSRAQSLAARWAAKEAFVKAWSAALLGAPPVLSEVDLSEIAVIGDAWQRPELTLAGRVAEAVRASLGEVSIHLSLTHESLPSGSPSSEVSSGSAMSLAMVVISR